MSALSLKEGWALSSGEPAGLEVTRQARRLFLSDHLGRWADAFAQGLREATLLPFHAAAADLLVRWIAAETRALGVTPEPLGAMTPRSPDESGPLTCPMGESTGGD
jgi:hypothetical protein